MCAAPFGGMEDIKRGCSHCAGRDLQKLYTHDTEEIKKETARIFSRLVDK